jgi:hypothetical protein
VVLVDFLRANADIVVWSPSDMPGIPREVAEHSLDICRMDLPGPTTSVGTRTDYSVGSWDYPACATRHLKAWSTRTTQE